MKTEQFEQIIERQFDRCRGLLVTKGKEYTPDRDVLEVFNKASELSGEGGRKASLFGFMLKHVVSISDMCHSDTVYDLDRWNEKITDTINYLLLLKAMVEEDEILRNDPRWGKEDRTTIQGFEWVPDKPSYASWDEMVKAVEGDTNSSCCMDCNECDYCVCDCTEDALLSCNNNCYGCPHMGCTKDMEPLDLTHLVQEPRDCRCCDYAIWSVDSDKETDIPFCFKKESDGCSGYARTPYWKEENKAEEEVTQEDWEDFWREDDGLSDEIAIAKEFENEFQ